MPLRLQEIQFNHDSSSASADAFNIRKNEQEFVEVPEWRRGKIKPEDSPAAYARRETRGNTLTIKANFSFDGAGQQDVLIRALDANFHPASQEPISGSLSPEEIQLLQKLVPTPDGNVLGAVKETPLTVSVGETVFQSFDLQNVRIWDVGVGADNIVWRWQYLVNETQGWIDLAVTTHRIYTTLHVPKEPWLKTPHEIGNTQLPWIAVLEHACAWARGAQNTDVAAEKITFSVNDLGRQKRICYGDGSGSYADVEAFDCGAFLALLRGEPGKGNSVNCDDCAAIVSTFANSIGCDLGQMCIRAIGKSEFSLKPHLRIGLEGIFENRAFGHHLVAAEGGCGHDVEVFDACLQIATDNSTGPTIFTLATNLAFSMGKSGYHFRLVATQDQPITHPHPDCKRRRIGPATSFGEECVDRPVVEEHFEFPSWKESNAPGNKLFVSEFFLAEYILSSLQVAAIQNSQPGATPICIQSLLTSAFFGEGKPFRIDVYETTSWQQAREGLMKTLAALAEFRLARQQIEGIGDVTFADPDFENILFAVGNLVFYLRNLCPKVGPLIDVAQNITEKILNLPPGIIGGPVPPDAVKQFSFTDGEVVAGTKVRLREVSAHPLASRRLYQFFADAGEVFRENDQLMYRPKAPGNHTLNIFAVDDTGNAAVQRLPLTVSSLQARW